MCDVDVEAVVAAVDAPSIYDIPKVLFSEELDKYVVDRLSLGGHDVVWGEWDDLLVKVHQPQHHVKVALVGKYIDLPDAYLSVSEALRAGGFANNAKIELVWVPSDQCATPQGAERALAGVDAMCVPGGFGIRGIEGKLGALTYARQKKIPTLGLCLGLQCMVIEAARNLAGIKDANSAEFDPGNGTHVIATMAGQEDVVAGAADMGGSMRLGLYTAELTPGSIVAGTYGATSISERHRHRYEVNNAHRYAISEAGLVFSGVNTELNLVEFVELPKEVHPYYVGTQAHPELRSRPTRPHPLFIGLIAAAIQSKG
jgi:CTP synthase